jgi:hypothetical protein
MAEHEFGPLKDVVKHSITLCHVLEASGSSYGGESGLNGMYMKFWKDRQAEFEEHAREYSLLNGNWYAPGCSWSFDYGSRGILHVPQQCQEVFEALARNAIKGIPDISATIRAALGPRVANEAEPWCIWLDLMRIRNWGFQANGHTPCTELEWDLGVKRGKPLDTIRREQKYTFGDEWKKIYERMTSGALRQLTERNRKGKGREELQKYFHWLYNGAIENVFATSARFCEDLTSRAIPAETHRIKTVAAEQPMPNLEARGAASSRRRRGRPQVIPEQAKAAAAKLKAAGRTNSEIAAVLYRTKHPTSQQTKNVPSILRHHKQKLKQPDSPASPRETPPKPG